MRPIARLEQRLQVACWLLNRWWIEEIARFSCWGSRERSEAGAEGNAFPRFEIIAVDGEAVPVT